MVPSRRRLGLGFVTVAVLTIPVAQAARADSLDATTRAALTRLPGDALLVAGLDVKAVRRTALFRRIVSAAEKDRDFKTGAASLKGEAGFDYRRDVDRVWLVVPSDAASGGRERMAFLAKGKIDQARFLAWLKRVEKVESRSAGKLTYYRSDDSAWAFLGDGWLLIAHADYVEEVLGAHARGSGRAIDDAAMMTAVRAASRSRASHAWLATVVPAAMKSKLRGDTFTRVFADLEWSAASATVGRTVLFRGEVRATTAEAASAAAGAMNAMVQMAAGNKGPADAGLSGAFSGGITAVDRTVSFSGSVAASKLAAALGRVLDRK
jgi:hypothetical protein